MDTKERIQYELTIFDKLLFIEPLIGGGVIIFIYTIFFDKTGLKEWNPIPILKICSFLYISYIFRYSLFFYKNLDELTKWYGKYLGIKIWISIFGIFLFCLSLCIAIPSTSWSPLGGKFVSYLMNYTVCICGMCFFLKPWIDSTGCYIMIEEQKKFNEESKRIINKK